MHHRVTDLVQASKVSRHDILVCALIPWQDRMKQPPVPTDADDYGKLNERSVSERRIAGCVVSLPSFLAALPDAERYAFAPVTRFAVAKLPLTRTSVIIS